MLNKYSIITLEDKKADANSDTPTHTCVYNIINQIH